MQKTKQIALDGPAGAGKSSVAKRLAQRLGYIYIDTGAMYRAVTWLVLKEKIDLSDTETLGKLLEQIVIEFGEIDEQGRQTVRCNGLDCTEEIRSTEVSNFVSAVSAIGLVRKVMVQKQQEIARNHDVVMDGRDIGTVVLPEAEYKFFLTASLDERAKRRMLELKDKGQTVDFEVLKAEMAERDRKDSQRAIAPLTPAADAQQIDTSKMTFDEVIENLFGLIIK